MMDRWMRINEVLTKEEWEALQPKPPVRADEWDGWHCCFMVPEDATRKTDPTIG